MTRSEGRAGTCAGRLIGSRAGTCNLTGSEGRAGKCAGRLAGSSAGTCNLTGSEGRAGKSAGKLIGICTGTDGRAANGDTPPATGADGDRRRTTVRTRPADPATATG